jgi:DNA-binding NtrC family response regulator
MEHAYIIAGGQQITPEHLPHHLLARPAETPALSLVQAPATLPAPSVAPTGSRTLRAIEMEHILRVVEKHHDNKPAAAQELGISLKTLYNKLNQLKEERKTAG